jgi:hypothetical protein
MARSERFELPTLGFEVRCSIQLSYERVSPFQGSAAAPNFWLFSALVGAATFGLVQQPRSHLANAISSREMDLDLERVGEFDLGFQGGDPPIGFVLAQTCLKLLWLIGFRAKHLELQGLGLSHRSLANPTVFYR